MDYDTDKVEADEGLAPNNVGNNVKGFKAFRLKMAPRQGHNLALTVLCVPSLLDSGRV